MFGMHDGWALYDANWAKDHIAESCGSGRYIFMCNCGVYRNDHFRNMETCDSYASSPNYYGNCRFGGSYISVPDRTWSDSSACIHENQETYLTAGKKTHLCDEVWMICASAASSYTNACDVCGCSDTRDTIDGTWVSNSNGSVASSVIAENGYATCRIVDPGYGEAAIKYGCASGYYYVSGSFNNTICEKCPTMDDSTTYRGTSNIGNKSEITGCYLPTGKNFTDNVGTYQFTSKCHYKE